MTTLFHPYQVLLVALAGWLNRHQQAVIDYLIEENRVLKEQLKGRRLRLSDEQHRRLAVQGKALGRHLLEEVRTLVTPDTLLAWHRKLIAQKWTYPQKGPGRPRVAQETTDLVLRMAAENAAYGYDRVQGALANLGHTIAPNTVNYILKKHGIEPAPERRKRTSWHTFVKAHWELVTATDFFTIEVWTRRDLLGLASPRRAVSEFLLRYHGERNYQGLGNRLIEPPSRLGTRDRPVRRRERLGGTLSYYCRLSA